jgi:hypothetical protein
MWHGIWLSCVCKNLEWNDRGLFASATSLLTKNITITSVTTGGNLDQFWTAFHPNIRANRPARVHLSGPLNSVELEENNATINPIKNRTQKYKGWREIFRTFGTMEIIQERSGRQLNAAQSTRSTRFVWTRVRGQSASWTGQKTFPESTNCKTNMGSPANRLYWSDGRGTSVNFIYKKPPPPLASSKRWD